MHLSEAVTDRGVRMSCRTICEREIKTSCKAFEVRSCCCSCNQDCKSFQLQPYICHIHHLVGLLVCLFLWCVLVIDLLWCAMQRRPCRTACVTAKAQTGTECVASANTACPGRWWAQLISTLAAQRFACFCSHTTIPIDNTIQIITRKLARWIASMVTNRRNSSTEEYKVYRPNTMIAKK